MEISIVMKYGYELNVYIDTQKIKLLVIVFDKKRESSSVSFKKFHFCLNG